MSHANALKALRRMCERRGLCLIVKRMPPAAYSVAIETRPTAAYHYSWLLDFARLSEHIKHIKAHVRRDFPRKPGAPRGNRNAAGKRTRPMHRAEAA